MTDLHAPTDAAIRAMLADRAERAGPFRIDVAAVVASAGLRASRRLIGGRPIERFLVGAAAIAAAVVATVLVAGPLAAPPAGSSGPASPPGLTSPPGSTGPVASSNGPSPSALPEARLLTAAEFGDLVRARSSALPPITVAVAGTLEADPTVRCRASICSTVLDGSGGVHVMPVGDIGPGPWDGSGPLTGTFALRTRAVDPAGDRLAEYIGTLTVPPTGGPAWFVQDLREGAVKAEGAYAAVQGWLVRTPMRPCPSNPRPPVIAYGCPTDDWLSESEFQPLQSDGSSIGPPAAIYLSSGSYDRWAPNPAAFGPDSVGVQPRYAIFLMRLVSDGCGPNADCAPPPPRWRIAGRFDPVEVAQAPADGVSVAQLADERPPMTTDYLVDGWLEAALTPGLRCLAPHPLPSGWPRHDCGRNDWLTDVPFRPSPTYAEPDVGIQLQSGAYDAFATNPVWADLLAEPRFGRYIVRVELHSTCDLAAPSPSAACLDGPVWTKELIGSAPP